LGVTEKHHYIDYYHDTSGLEFHFPFFLSFFRPSVHLLGLIISSFFLGHYTKRYFASGGHLRNVSALFMSDDCLNHNPYLFLLAFLWGNMDGSFIILVGY